MVRIDKKEFNLFMASMALDYKKILVQVSTDMDIQSYVPKDQTFIDSIDIEFRDNGVVRVGSDVVYAVEIEDGRQAGSHVPLQPLVDWCIYKLHMDQKEAVIVARRIERKIFREGIKARQPFRVSLYRFGAILNG